MTDEHARTTQPRLEIGRTFARELRFAGRSLGRTPAFTLAAIITLGLGIGATTSIYTVLDAVVLRPLPFPDAGRLVQLGSEVPGLGPEQRWGMSEAGYYHFREHAASYDAIGIVGSAEFTVTGDFEAERVRAGLVSASLFDVLRLAPGQGRPFRDAEERDGAPPVALLGWDYWQRRFGGEPVLGRTITIAGTAAEIVGVMDENVHLPMARVDLWLPRPTDPARPPVNWHWVSGLARLRPGVDLSQARTEAARLTAQFPTLFPEAYDDEFMNRYRFATYVSPLHEEVMGGMARTIWILLAAVSFVLLIAVANVVNLFLVRLEAKRRETAVRGALGAGRRHLLLHFLGESLLVATGAFAAALLVAHAATRLLVALAPPGFPRLTDVGVTGGRSQSPVFARWTTWSRDRSR